MTAPQYESVAELYEDLLSSKSLQCRKTKPGFVASNTESRTSQEELVGTLEKYRIVSALAFTTVISSCLLAGNIWQWTTSDNVYHTITKHRATVQFIIQLVANILGVIDVSLVCLLINYSTRLRLASSRISLELLHFWNNILLQKLDWDLPFHLIFSLILFLAFCMLPSALWAAAITPISILAIGNGSAVIPSWENTALLHQDHTLRSGLPSLQTQDGTFVFGVGEAFAGALLASAASATTFDGSVRKHAKQDLTGFTYVGRSYGVGSAVGLSISPLGNLSSPLGQRYSYLEPGYHPQVTCIYNSSSAYSISTIPYGNETMVFSVNGLLPNSNGVEEWARLASYSAEAIVSIGVASSPDSQGRIFGIAAGKNYANLNSTQCTIDFQPTFFNVSVDFNGRNITVLPLPTKNITDIEPTGFLTFLANWQFSLLSSDQSRLYSSAIGDAFSQSINNYIASTVAMNGTKLMLSEATLPGLQNSIEAMLDDILVAYSSAQIMVANQMRMVDGVVYVAAFQLGERSYIIAVVVLNMVLVVALGFEATRTRGWRGLVAGDLMSLRDVVNGVERVVEEYADAELAGLHEGVNSKPVGARANALERLYVRQAGRKFLVGSLRVGDEMEGWKSRRDGGVGCEDRLLVTGDSAMAEQDIDHLDSTCVHPTSQNLAPI